MRWLLCFLCCVALASSASAQTRPAWNSPLGTPQATPDRALGMEHFRRGRERLQAGDLEGALAAFVQSHDTYPSPNSRLLVARTLRDLHRNLDAYGEYLATIEDAREDAHPERLAATIAAAEQESAGVLRLLAQFRLRLDGLPRDRVTSFAVEGVTFTTEMLGVAIPMEPGAKHITVLAEGFEVFEADITLTANETLVLSPVLSPIAVPPPTRTQAPEVLPVVEEAAHDWVEPVRVGGVTTLAVGLLASALGSAFLVAANDRYNALSASCGGPCPLSASDVWSEGVLFESVGNASLIGGGIVGLTGLVLTLVGFASPTTDHRLPTHVRVSEQGLRVSF
jgi:hypothetical protein